MPVPRTHTKLSAPRKRSHLLSVSAGLPQAALVTAASPYVAPAHRGQDGPAQALMEAAIDFARRHTECARLTLGVREDDHRAMAFHRRIGFHDPGMTAPYPLDPTRALRILDCPDFRVGR
ncbi:GNAT family N-acetyltransferase [Streptomyces anulatus]